MLERGGGERPGFGIKTVYVSFVAFAAMFCLGSLHLSKLLLLLCADETKLTSAVRASVIPPVRGVILMGVRGPLRVMLVLPSGHQRAHE